MGDQLLSDWLAKALSKAWHTRKSYILQNKFEAYRLINRGESGLDLAIDIYGSNAVIHIFGHQEFLKISSIEVDLKKLLGISNFYHKDRTKEGKLSLGKNSSAQPTASNSNEFIQHINDQQKFEKKEITVKEYDHFFLINLSDYLDCGLFLDHRETRQWIGQQSKNKIVLNTFAYTGSFSIYAAKGGAIKTYSVDLSKTYCDWIKKNLELNDLPPGKNWVYKMDTLEFFDYARRKNLLFDIIIIDPPTFSRNNARGRGQRFSVQADHVKLLKAAASVLSKNGFILFSNNCQNFKLNKALEKTFKVENITRQTIPLDFSQTLLPKGNLAHHCFLLRK